jgi:hypothetical protein
MSGPAGKEYHCFQQTTDRQKKKVYIRPHGPVTGISGGTRILQNRSLVRLDHLLFALVPRLAHADCTHKSSVRTSQYVPLDGPPMGRRVLRSFWSKCLVNQGTANYRREELEQSDNRRIGCTLELGSRKLDI